MRMKYAAGSSSRAAVVVGMRCMIILRFVLVSSTGRGLKQRSQLDYLSEPSRALIIASAATELGAWLGTRLEATSTRAFQAR